MDAPQQRGSVTKDTAPVLLTLQKAALWMGVPYNSVRDLVIDGYLARVQLGNSRRIWVRRADVERLIEQSTTLNSR
jgi:excisionase family DNA binding protein